MVRCRISNLTIVRVGLLIVGIVCLGMYVYSLVSERLYQSQAEHQFEEARNGTARTVSATKSTRHLASSSIGRISVPRLHLSAMVAEGVDDGTLARAVGHVPGTSLPGERGNVAVAGHRDTFFRSLQELKPNDEIVFTTLDGSFRYAVREMKIVEPNNVAVLDPTARNTLTIVTCYPFRYIGAAPKRYIVQAEEVAEEGVRRGSGVRPTGQHTSRRLPD
jgi:sortase A